MTVKLIRDALGTDVPQTVDDNGNIVVHATGDTTGIDFSKTKLLRDALGTRLPNQIYDVDARKWVLDTGQGGSGGGGTGEVTSVNGKKGVVVLNSDDVGAASKTEFNSHLAQNPFDGHTGKVSAARITHSVNQVIPNLTATTLSFDSVDFDNSDMYNASNNTRLTAQEKGIYLIIGTVRFEFNAEGSRILQIKKNSSITVAATSLPPSTDQIRTGCEITTIIEMDVGDYVEIIVTQLSGIPLPIMSEMNFSPIFSMVRVV